MKAASILLTLFVISPIWYYLLYRILLSVHASELMMFLFWIYIPAGFLVKIMFELADKDKKPQPPAKSRWQEKIEEMQSRK